MDERIHQTWNWLKFKRKRTDSGKKRSTSMENSFLDSYSCYWLTDLQSKESFQLVNDFEVGNHTPNKYNNR